MANAANIALGKLLQIAVPNFEIQHVYGDVGKRIFNLITRKNHYNSLTQVVLGEK